MFHENNELRPFASICSSLYYNLLALDNISMIE